VILWRKFFLEIGSKETLQLLINGFLFDTVGWNTL